MYIIYIIIDNNYNKNNNIIYIYICKIYTYNIYKYNIHNICIYIYIHMHIMGINGDIVNIQSDTLKTLWESNIATEHHNFKEVNHVCSWLLSHSYVKLPEANYC